MMRKKKLYGLLIFTLMLALNGCSLAKEDAGQEAVGTEEMIQDRLIGVVVTDEHLDLFDIDTFLKDNVDNIADGETLDGSQSVGYQGRIYATVNKNGSDEPFEWDITFAGVMGYSLFAPKMQHGDGETFNMVEGSDGICDVKTNYMTTDDGQEIHLTGTLYLQSGAGRDGAAYYMNPVYQTEEGEIYLMSGNGISSNVAGEDGSDMSSKLDGTCTTTENGETTTYTGSVEIKFITADPPTKISFYYMDAGHEILGVEGFVSGEVPEEMKAVEGTSYVLVETERVNSAGIKKIERETYEPDEEGTADVETFYPSEAGTLSKQFTKITFGS